MSLTDLIPAPYRWLILLALIGASFAAGGVLGMRHEATVATAREAKQVQQQLQAQVAATAHTLATEHQRQDAVQEIANETRQQSEHYQAAAADNRAAGERLRGQLAAARTDCARAAQPAAAAGSAPAQPTADLLADVQRRLAEAEDATVEFADSSRRAGLACEQSYQAVSPASTPKE